MGDTNSVVSVVTLLDREQGCLAGSQSGWGGWSGLWTLDYSGLCCMVDPDNHTIEAFLLASKLSSEVNPIK